MKRNSFSFYVSDRYYQSAVVHALSPNMRSVHSVAAFAAIVSLVAAKPVPSATSGWGPSGTSNASILASALSPPFLNDLARAKGKLWLGTAVDIPGSGEDTDVEYQTILNDTNIFGQLTPANYMKVSCP